MTIKESRKFIAVLMVTYQNYKPIDVELAANMWANMTEEYNYSEINRALKIYICSDTSGFAPTPGQIIDNIYKLIEPQELNEMEAWALVSKAIKNSGYKSVEEFSKLPLLVQKAVGIPEQLRVWALDESFNEGVVSSNFMRCYREVALKAKEMHKMSKDTRDRIEAINKNSYAYQLEDRRTLESEENNQLELDNKNNNITYDKNDRQVPQAFKDILNKLKEQVRNENKCDKTFQNYKN